jgi:hypothetical protein
LQKDERYIVQKHAKNMPNIEGFTGRIRPLLEEIPCAVAVLAWERRVRHNSTEARFSVGHLWSDTSISRGPGHRAIACLERNSDLPQSSDPLIFKLIQYQALRGIAFGILPTHESVNKAYACPLPTATRHAEAVFDPHNRRILYITSHLGVKSSKCDSLGKICLSPNPAKGSSLGT